MQLGIVYYLMYLAYLDLYAIAKRIKCLKVGYEVTLYRVRLFVVHVLFQRVKQVRLWLDSILELVETQAMDDAKRREELTLHAECSALHASWKQALAAATAAEERLEVETMMAAERTHRSACHCGLRDASGHSVYLRSAADRAGWFRGAERLPFSVRSEFPNVSRSLDCSCVCTCKRNETLEALDDMASNTDLFEHRFHTPTCRESVERAAVAHDVSATTQPIVQAVTSLANEGGRKLGRKLTSIGIPLSHGTLGSRWERQVESAVAPLSPQAAEVVHLKVAALESYRSFWEHRRFRACPTHGYQHSKCSPSCTQGGPHCYSCAIDGGGWSCYKIPGLRESVGSDLLPPPPPTVTPPRGPPCMPVESIVGRAGASSTHAKVWGGVSFKLIRGSDPLVSARKDTECPLA